MIKTGGGLDFFGQCTCNRTTKVSGEFVLEQSMFFSYSLWFFSSGSYSHCKYLLKMNIALWKYTRWHKESIQYNVAQEKVAMKKWRVSDFWGPLSAPLYEAMGRVSTLEHLSNLLTRKIYFFPNLIFHRERAFQVLTWCIIFVYSSWNLFAVPLILLYSLFIPPPYLVFYSLIFIL